VLAFARLVSFCINRRGLACTGTGDVIEPDNGVIGIGSGGALASPPRPPTRCSSRTGT
jgi:ATP-dependent protease HslVU (ClpYQ) peptidase subunit